MHNSNNNYQRLQNRIFQSFWKRRCIGSILITICMCIVVVLIHEYNTSIPNTSEDYIDEDTKKVYLDEDTWYNDKEMLPANSSWFRYLKAIRERWILWEYNSSMPYALENPELFDPSMGQARAIREIFGDKKNGFFVECGAYDGETRSNTLAFERFFDWMGLLVEADPLNFSKMMGKNRKAFLSPTCLSIKPRPVVASFLMASNVGRLHDNNETNLKNSPDVAHNGMHIGVQCFPFAHLLAALGIKTVDYFSLDIEGNEIDVLETIPFESLNIKTLSVEHIHNKKSRKYLIDLMQARGYYVHRFVERSDNLANDVIFVKQEL